MFGFKCNKAKALVSVALTLIGLNMLCCKANENKNSSNDFQLSYKDGHLTKQTHFGGVEVSLFERRSEFEAFNAQPRSVFNNTNTDFRPEISLFTSAEASKISTTALNAAQRGKSNRYKNTIPAVYRLTLKGYSIMEYSNNVAHTWSLDKVKNRVISKPTIMFSVTKRF